ncbi:MAG: hypothetical protein ACJ8C4_04130 [Gemmataceae bacterium]
MIRKIAFVGCCLAAFCCNTLAAPVPAKPVSSLSMVPAQCPIVLQVRGLDRAKGRLKTFLTAADAKWGALAAQSIDDALKNLPEGRKLQGLAPNGPVFIAFSDLPKMGSVDPSFALIARVNSFKEFTEGLLTDEERKRLKVEPGGYQSVEIDNQLLFLMDRSDHAIVTFTKESAEIFAKPFTALDAQMAKDLQEKFITSDVSAYVNMGTVIKVYGDKIRETRDQFLVLMNMAAAADPNSAEIAKKLYGGVFQLALDSDAVVVGVDFRPEALALSTQIRVGTDSETNEFFKAQKPTTLDKLSIMPRGQMMYVASGGLSPETSKTLMLMNGGMAAGSERITKAIEELELAGGIKSYSTSNYPIARMIVEEFQDAPKALRATVGILESLDDGARFGSGYVKTKPEIKTGAESFRDIAWTSYRIVWDHEKFNEMPVGGDEAKKSAKKMLGDQTFGWLGISGNRLIEVQAKDWETARGWLEAYFTGKGTIGSDTTPESAAFRLTHQAMPQPASLISLADVGPIALLMAESMLPQIKAGTLFPFPVPAPAELTPVKFTPSYLGFAATLQAERLDFNIFVPASAGAEVNKIVNQFVMGGN